MTWAVLLAFGVSLLLWAWNPGSELSKLRLLYKSACYVPIKMILELPLILGGLSGLYAYACFLILPMRLGALHPTTWQHMLLGLTGVVISFWLQRQKNQIKPLIGWPYNGTPVKAYDIDLRDRSMARNLHEAWTRAHTLLPKRVFYRQFSEQLLAATVLVRSINHQGQLHAMEHAFLEDLTNSFHQAVKHYEEAIKAKVMPKMPAVLCLHNPLAILAQSSHKDFIDIGVQAKVVLENVFGADEQFLLQKILSPMAHMSRFLQHQPLPENVYKVILGAQMEMARMLERARQATDDQRQYDLQATLEQVLKDLQQNLPV